MKLHEGIVAFTDGASRGNPGPGGWGFALIDTDNQVVYETAGFDTKTTNNAMELTAVVEALRHAHKKNISHMTLYTDSAYVAQGMTMWIFGWIKKGWKTQTGESIQNLELWKKCFALMQDVLCDVKRVSGHSGVSMNERVDELATMAADSKKKFSKDYSFSEYVTMIDTFMDMPTNIRPAKPSSATEKKVAYSYISLVDGKIMTHKTWDETKARVHGKAAKYKKVFSADEERAVIDEFKK